MKRILISAMTTILTMIFLLPANSASAYFDGPQWNDGSGSYIAEPECTEWEAFWQDCADTYLYRQVMAGTLIPDPGEPYRDPNKALMVATYMTLVGKVFEGENIDAVQRTNVENSLKAIRSGSNPECTRSAMLWYVVESGSDAETKTSLNMFYEGVGTAFGNAISLSEEAYFNKYGYYGINRVELPNGWDSAVGKYLEVVEVTHNVAWGMIGAERLNTLSARILSCQ